MSQWTVSATLVLSVIAWQVYSQNSACILKTVLHKYTGIDTEELHVNHIATLLDSIMADNCTTACFPLPDDNHNLSLTPFGFTDSACSALSYSHGINYVSDC